MAGVVSRAAGGTSQGVGSVGDGVLLRGAGGRAERDAGGVQAAEGLASWIGGVGLGAPSLMDEETEGRRRPAYGLGGGFWLGGGELAAGPAGFGAGEHGGEEWGVVEVLVELLALFAVE